MISSLPPGVDDGDDEDLDILSSEDRMALAVKSVQENVYSINKAAKVCDIVTKDTFLNWLFSGVPCSQKYTPNSAEGDQEQA